MSKNSTKEDNAKGNWNTLFWPSVSIIIPAYNEEQYIADTLQTVAKLTYPKLEVIVVDNNSKDDTARVVKEFSEVRYVFEKKQGTLHALEAGRKAAQGEVIIRLDADCAPTDRWLYRGLKHFQKSEVVAVSGPYDYHDGAPLFRATSRLTQQTIHFGVHTLVQNVLEKAAVMLGGNSFIRKEAVEAIGGFDTTITFFGDDTHVGKQLTTIGRVEFDPRLIIKSSARRFNNEGWVKVFSEYNSNFFSMIFLDKPVSETKAASEMRKARERLDKHFFSYFRKDNDNAKETTDEQ